MAKLWTDPLPLPEYLAQDLPGVPPHILQALYNRGLQTRADIFRYFTPDEESQGGPFAMKGMRQAVERIETAIGRGEQIAVYGDFDVDGISSAALLMQTLAALGADAQVYIPRRLEEGYGLNKPAMETLAARGVRLLVSVDCGTASVAEIAHAARHGIDVIVADHHSIPSLLPAAVAILNPHQTDCPYPYKDLAGVGVTFRLAQALLSRRRDVSLSETALLDLVALGTVVDVAPLTGENRILVRQGLQALNTTQRPGLVALRASARLAPNQAIEARTLSYVLGPRLNAAGRLADAIVSYRLLLTNSMAEAQELAQQLEASNTERQQLTEESVLAARQQAQEQMGQPLILVGSEDFRSGIIGLVASRLAEDLYRPVVVVQQDEEYSRGSCRSVPGFHMARALDDCDDLLLRHGGHASAAGFTVRNDLVNTLHKRLLALATEQLGVEAPAAAIAVDAQIPLALANWDTLAWLRRMEPFGTGNPPPVFASQRVRIGGIWPARKDHLRLTVSDGRLTWDALALRMAPLAEGLRKAPYVDLAYHLEARHWNGDERLSLIVLDLRPSQA